MWVELWSRMRGRGRLVIVFGQPRLSAVFQPLDDRAFRDLGWSHGADVCVVAQQAVRRPDIRAQIPAPPEVPALAVPRFAASVLFGREVSAASRDHSGGSSSRYTVYFFPTRYGAPSGPLS
jgi:hypothetical protein